MTVLLLLEKSPNGWWKVKADGAAGWVPSSVAQRKRRLKSDRVTEKNKSIDESEEKLYVTISNYVPNEEAGLSFEPNEIVEVMSKDPNGWWFVKIGQREGWAPSNYLKKYEPKGSDLNTLQDVLIQVETVHDSYENVVIPHIPSSDQLQEKLKFIVKPPLPPKPTVLPKPSVLPKQSLAAPKPAPRSASCNQMDLIQNKHAIKQKPDLGKPNLPNGYDHVRAQPRPLSASYSNVDLNTDQGSHGQLYVAMADYQDTDDDNMLTFKAAQLLLVTKKDDNGWWFAEVGDQGGWVPSNYLKEN